MRSAAGLSMTSGRPLASTAICPWTLNITGETLPVLDGDRLVDDGKWYVNPLELAVKIWNQPS